jgi:hypothetical protein
MFIENEPDFHYQVVKDSNIQNIYQLLKWDSD